MSNIPHYLPSLRSGIKLGPGQLLDGVVHDGLWDVYNNQHMGMCGEKCAEDYAISRDDQDKYAIESYRRANEAIASGKFKDEIAPVEVKSRKGSTTVDVDAEPTNFDVGKMEKLRPAFKRDGGTVTAANASSLNDGAASMIIMSEKQVGGSMYALSAHSIFSASPRTAAEVITRAHRNAPDSPSSISPLGRKLWPQPNSEGARLC